MRTSLPPPAHFLFLFPASVRSARVEHERTKLQYLEQRYGQ